MKISHKFTTRPPIDIDDEIRKFSNMLLDDNALKKAPKKAVYKYIYIENIGWGRGYDDNKIKTIIFSMLSLTGLDFIGVVFNKLGYKEISSESLQLAVTQWLINNGNNPHLSESALRVRDNLGIEFDIRNFITGEWVSMLKIAQSTIYPADIINPQWIRFE